jgi:hypothetical protein
MEIEFINYAPYNEYDGYINNLKQDEFNRTRIKYTPGVFSTNHKYPNITEHGKNKEIELLNLELENINLKMKDNERYDHELYTKRSFLAEKIKFLSNLNSSQWKYNLGIIKNDVRTQVVAKKNSYTTKDIMIIAKVLLAVQKNKDARKFEIINSFTEIYLGKNPSIRIYHIYQDLFDCDTRDFLLKMLSYFVSLSKPDFIGIALQTIDIFTNKTHSNAAIELHKEILRNYDIRKYKEIYEQEIIYGTEGNCEIFFTSLEKEIFEKLNEAQDKKTYKSKNDRDTIDKITCEAKKYFSAKTKGNEMLFDKNERIWKFTSVNYGERTSHWYVGIDFPEKAHPKYSEYIDMKKFVTFIVDTKKIFHEKEMQIKFANLPSL